MKTDRWSVFIQHPIEESGAPIGPSPHSERRRTCQSSAQRGSAEMMSHVPRGRPRVTGSKGRRSHLRLMKMPTSEKWEGNKYLLVDCHC